MERIGINAILPSEMIEQIFCFLPHRDLKTVVLVCKRWRKVGESPNLWTWVSLKATSRTLSLMPGMIASRRLQRATTMIIRSIDTQLLEAVNMHPIMREVDFRFTNLSAVPPASLTQVINGLESANLNYTSLNCEQTEAILASVSSADSKLRKLDLGNSKFSISVPEAPVSRSSIPQIEATLKSVGLIDISRIAIGLLSAACSKLLEINLENTRMTGLQARELFALVADAKTPLKVVRIGHNQLDSAGADLMGEAAGKLTELGLSQTSLLPDQAKSVFASTAKNHSQLRRLDMDGNDLSWVPIRDLAAAVSSLEEVLLARTSLTSSQMRTVLNVNPKHGCRRRRVLSMAGLNLSSIEPDLLAKAVATLNKADLHHTSLTKDQATRLLISLSDAGNLLEDLNIGHNNLSLVDPTLFILLSKLTSATLNFCHLTSAQAENLFIGIQTGSTNLKRLLLGRNNLAALQPALLASSVSSLEELRMRQSSLSDEQVEAILQQSVVGTNLKILMLADVRRRNIDTDLVNSAKGLIEHVNV